jgi:HSP20 family protein
MEAMANIVTRRNQPAPLSRPFGERDPFELMRELMQWSPFADLPSRLFSEDATRIFEPRFDVREEKDAFIFKADLPGFKEEDIEISLNGNLLTVSGKREEETAEPSGTYYYRERSYGSFSRTFTLPEGVKADQVQASMQDGVLSLRLPQSPETQPKKIPLKSGNGGDGGEGGKSSS